MSRAREARMDIGHAPEEQAVARCGEGNAGSRHNCAVECDKYADRHGGGDQGCSPGSGDGSQCRHRWARGRGDLRAGKMYWMAAFVAIYSTPTMPSPAMRAMGRLRCGLLHLARHHGEVVPAVVGPERGDERDHEAAEAAMRAQERSRRSFPSVRLLDAKQIPAIATISTPLSHVKTSWKSPALRMPR